MCIRDRSRDVALARGNDDKLALGCQSLELGNAGALYPHLAFEAGEFAEPSRYLHTLVHRHRRRVQTRSPRERTGVLRAHDREIDVVDTGTFAVPAIDAELALSAQCGVEHALARGHTSVADLRGALIGEQDDLMTGLAKPDRKLQSRLTCADDADLSHAIATLRLTARPDYPRRSA